MKRACVFLDRDDTLIECTCLPPPPPPAAKGDLVDPALVRLLPGVLEGCARLAGAGFALVVVTNQGVVARGGADTRRVEIVNDRVRELLTVDGRPLVEAVYYCPFHPKGAVTPWVREHAWRKPGAGMILAAAEDLDLDLEKSWLIGDAQRDIDAAESAGLGGRAVMVGDSVSFAAAVERVVLGA
ncbi:MAG: HAD-IIIA family hydrolase [Planctomycetes bacterium]|nr:HAD-IIIA family hydrolase [Planctomycetota bacterium]